MISLAWAGEGTAVSASRLMRWTGLILFIFLLFVPHRYLGNPDWGGLRWLPPFTTTMLLTGSLLAFRARLGELKLLRAIGAVLVIDFLGAIASSVPRLAIPRSLYLTLTGPVVCVILFVGLRNLIHIRGFWRAIVLAGALNAILGIIEFGTGQNVWSSVFNHDNFLYTQFASDTFGRRILGTVGHPVFLGFTFACLLPIALHFALSETNWIRPLFWAAFVLILLALVLTFTRGAYITAVVGLSIYCWYQSPRSRSTVLIVVAIVLFAALSLESIQGSLLSRNTIEQLGSVRTDQRGIAYRQATQLLAGSPMIGYGSGHYRYLSKYQHDYNQTLDNMYLRLLVENGIAGLVAWLYLFVGFSEKIFRTSHKFEKAADQHLARAIGASFLICVLNMVTCDALAFPLTRYVTWALIGSGIAMISSLDTQATRRLA